MKNKTVISVDTMHAMDQYTCEHLKISPLTLMKRAGDALARHLLQDGWLSQDKKIRIVAGTGNNGGDGLVMALAFVRKGFDIAIVIMSKPESLSPDCAQLRDELEEKGCRIHYAFNQETLTQATPTILSADYLVDGLFGTGLKRPLSTFFESVVHTLNNSRAMRISIDIPSGLNADTGQAMPIAVKADKTLVVQCYKRGNLLEDARDYHGDITVIDVGIQSEKPLPNEMLLEVSHIPRIPKRAFNTHKYDYGSVVVFGGSPTMMGAPTMAAYAALKSGAGLASIAVHEAYQHAIVRSYPELLTYTYNDHLHLETILNKKSAVVFGCGLGKENTLSNELLKKVIATKHPVLIDADGLHYFKMIMDDVRDAPLILTPHMGELIRLMDMKKDTLREHLIKQCQAFVQNTAWTLVIKGPTTVIIDKDATVYTQFGTPGLATAGTGDVLAGMIARFMAVESSNMDAALRGVALHGLSAQYAESVRGAEGLVATDLLNWIPQAIETLTIKLNL